MQCFVSPLAVACFCGVVAGQWGGGGGGVVLMSVTSGLCGAALLSAVVE